MSSMFRICYPQIPQVLYLENGVFSGITSGITRHFVSMLQGINYTLVQETSFGNIIDQQTLAYDGCIGSMQRNESDNAIVWITVPVPGPNLTQVAVSGADQPVIVANYKKIATDISQVDVQVLNMYRSMTTGVWMMVTATLLAYLILITLSAYTKRVDLMRSGVTRRKARILTSRPVVKSLNIIIACALRQPASCDSSLQDLSLVRIMYLWLTIFAFLINFYLCTMIKTDMVIIKKPTVVETYADILYQDIRPLWLQMIGDHWEFQRAKPGTIESKIWQKALEIGINESLVVPAGINDMTSLTFKVTGMKHVLITSKLLAKVVSANACAASRTLAYDLDSFTYNHVDPAAREVLRGFVQNHLAPAREAAILTKRMKRLLEFSLMDHEIEEMKFGLISPKGRFIQTEECLANKIVYPEPLIHALNWNHYRYLFAMTAASYLLAIIVHALDW